MDIKQKRKEYYKKWYESHKDFLKITRRPTVRIIKVPVPITEKQMDEYQLYLQNKKQREYKKKKRQADNFKNIKRVLSLKLSFD
jgi:hypothetical protein